MDKKLIYKEANHSSGTREICNHIVCKITLDILNKLKVKKLQYFIQNDCFNIPYVIIKFLLAYQGVASENLNARIALLYAIYVYIIAEHPCAKIRQFISKIYDRIYNEARLCLEVDYRELWLLENSLCILINDIYLE